MNLTAFEDIVMVGNLDSVLVRVRLSERGMLGEIFLHRKESALSV